MISLKDKNVLITGASAGIGRACAEAFASIGARLILTARREEKLIEISDMLKDKYQTESVCYKLDVRNSEEVLSTINNLPDEWENIDILINNAGLALGIEKLQDSDPGNWDTMIDTNVKGMLYVYKAVIPGMIRRNSGYIINLSSIAGHQVYTGGNVYCASKFAVDALTQAMQIELVETPIRVTAISPGMVETDFSLVRFSGDSEKAANVYKGIDPLTAEDIADAIVYCVTRPPHVNINDMIIMATNQANAYTVYKKS